MLEIGCDLGECTKRLTARGCTVLAVDKAADRLRTAQDAVPGATFLLCDVLCDSSGSVFLALHCIELALMWLCSSRFVMLKRHKVDMSLVGCSLLLLLYLHNFIYYISLCLVSFTFFQEDTLRLW